MTKRSRCARREGIALGLVALLAVLYSSLLVAGTDPHVSLDDAFITLVYARNFADSGSFYYNVEDGPVDGFTSLLDVVIKSVGLAFAPASPFGVAMATNLIFHALFLVGCTLAIARASRVLPRHRWPWMGISVLVVASSPDLAQATATGLETPLFLLLSLAAIQCLPDPNKRRIGQHAFWAGALLLLVATRPEGLAVAGVVGGTYALSHRRVRLARGVVGVLALGVATFCAWRILVFGDWAPNTYYAKTSDSRWLEILDGLSFAAGYARYSLVDALKVLAVFAAPMALVAKQWRNGWNRWRYGTLAISGLVVFIATVVAGGDCYATSRRMLALPMTLLLLLPVHLAAHRRRVLRRLAIGFTILVAVGTVPGSLSIAAQVSKTLARGELLFARDRAKVACTRGVSERIAELLPNATIAQSDFQAFKFFAPNNRVIDLHGLNHRVIAHMPVAERVQYGKFSQAYGIHANAEVYIYGLRPSSPKAMAKIPLKRLLNDPFVYERFIGYGNNPLVPERQRLKPEQARALEAAYLPASLPSCGRYFNFLIRRDVAHSLRGTEVLVGR